MRKSYLNWFKQSRLSKLFVQASLQDVRLISDLHLTGVILGINQQRMRSLKSFR